METHKKCIFFVDDNLANLTVGRNALSSFYNVITIPSAAKMFAMLEKRLPDLILLDIEMPQMNGYEAIRILKSDPVTEPIPVIFVTAKNDNFSELEGLTLGAVDYIGKPFSLALLKKRIELHLLVESQKRELQQYNDNLQQMVEEKTQSVLLLQNSVLKTVSELVECRDDVTGGHIERTQEYLRLLLQAARENGLYIEQIVGWDINFLLQSSQLHDVGKIAIRDSVLLKPGKLTDEEFELMKTHTTFGVQVIERIQQITPESSFLEHAKIFAGTHHEKWNGAGYPNHLKGEEIPLQGRLMAIADVYDALTNARPYKPAYSHEEACEIIQDGRGTHFDPQLIDLFMEYSRQIQTVKISSGKHLEKGTEV